jgi:hypothetical protein
MLQSHVPVDGALMMYLVRCDLRCRAMLRLVSVSVDFHTRSANTRPIKPGQ